MANQNVTQLPLQTGSADSTSLFYAVKGGSLDTGLPLSVLVNSIPLTGIPTTPTATLGTNTQQIANCSYVLASYAAPSAIGTTTPNTAVFTSVTINTPLGVASGGSGVNTLTAFGLVMGNGTSAVTTVNPGTSGLVLTSNGVSAAPTYQSIPWSTPGTIGSTTPNTGAFTTLSASSTVSGAGFSTYLAAPPAIGNSVANTGAFTTLSASSTVSGTGFSTYLASPPPIGSTARSTGAFTSLAANNGLTVSASGASITGGLIMSTGQIIPVSTSGIAGTTTNDNAIAGAVGEYATNTTTLTSLTTGVPANATSISLTAGDWDVEGTVTFNPAGTTTVTAIQAGINTVSATLPANNTGGYNLLFATLTTGSAQVMSSPVVRISIASTTTVYLIAVLAFGTSTANCNGFIRARRVR